MNRSTRSTPRAECPGERTERPARRGRAATPRAAGRLAVALLLGLAAQAASAAVEGRLVTPGGDPIEGARVRLLAQPPTDGAAADADAALAVSGRDGSFAFPRAELPARLRIEHPRFDPLAVELAAGDETTLTLSPRQDFFDELVVTAGREQGSGVKPVSVAATFIEPDDRPAPSGTVVELVQGVAGVAENGQGGRFQAYSIRGIAGQRVQSLVAGARIVTERRAGATASFVDPLLLAQVDVVRGPYSSYYGSSALGGVLQALPAHFRSATVDAGWESEGSARYARVGTGGESWSLALAYRGADDAETPGGLKLFSRYEQWSATLLKDFELGNGLQAELLVLPAVGRDIGKPNARFPGRTTIYPDENHLITRFTLRRPGSWRLDLWAHPNDLKTLNIRSDRRDVVDSEALDFGLNLQRELDLGRQWVAQLGLDYFGRRDVTATEYVESFESGEITEATTLDGSEDEAALYASVRRGFSGFDLEAGARYTWLGQSNAGAPSTDDTAASGFVGVTVPLGGGLELAANLGTGLRFPGLSERFFTGATGRGEVFANPDLEPERSLSADVGVRWYGQRHYLAAYVFRNEIDDYIERLELDTGVSTFANLTAGTIEGLELEGFFQVSGALRLNWAGQTVEGRSDTGDPLADIASDRVEGGLSWSRGLWLASGRWQHRFAKSDPGPGEQRVDSADVVSASVGYRIAEGTRLTLSISNLLDEEYLPSADDLAVPAQRRSVGLGLSWRP